jgi:hypothetical protein
LAGERSKGPGMAGIKDLLRHRKDTIEQAFGDELEWLPEDKGKVCLIRYVIRAADCATRIAGKKSRSR